PDLRHATCFVMPLGGEDIDEVLVGLKRAAPFLRGEVGRRIRLRLVPELSFKPDVGFDHAQRIDTLLKGTDDV
ncbi:MAG: ribosome-binding factor A, partial [Alphaproteobacteria bacterium]